MPLSNSISLTSPIILPSKGLNVFPGKDLCTFLSPCHQHSLINPYYCFYNPPTSTYFSQTPKFTQPHTVPMPLSFAKLMHNRDKSKITASEMRFMRYTAGYTKWDHKRNEDILHELHIEPVFGLYTSIPKQLDSTCIPYAQNKIS